MKADYRDDLLFKQAEDLARAWPRPGSGQASSIGQIMISPDGRRVAGAAVVCEFLEGLPSTRIALIDLESGELKTITNGPRLDSSPKWSPDGSTILSDRDGAISTAFTCSIC